MFKTTIVLSFLVLFGWTFLRSLKEYSNQRCISGCNENIWLCEQIKLDNFEKCVNNSNECRKLCK